MFRFIRESIKEFDHVVFPTRQETKTYFVVVVAVIVVMMAYVFIVSSLISEGFRVVRPLTATNSSTTFDPSELIETGSGLSLTGVTASGAGLSGAVITPDSATGALLPQEGSAIGAASANP